MASSTDDLIRDYGAELAQIHERNTVGDHTWTGVLASFLAEYIASTPKAGD